MRSSGEPKATATKGEDLMGGPKGVFVGGQLINIFWMKYLLVSPTNLGFLLSNHQLCLGGSSISWSQLMIG